MGVCTSAGKGKGRGNNSPEARDVDDYASIRNNLRIDASGSWISNRQTSNATRDSGKKRKNKK